MEYVYKPTDYEIKLIILYAVKSLKIGASYTILDYVISSSANVNYFELEQYIKSLLSSGNIVEVATETENIFSITESGEETLGFFANKIPGSIMERLDAKITEINREEAIGNRIFADYYPINENEYIVKFSLEEGKTLLMSMEIYAGSMDRAKKMCAYLKSNTGDFYKKVANIMNEGMM